MLQVGVATAVAYHDVIFATYDPHGISGGIPCLETFLGHVDYHPLGLASLDADTLETS